MLESKQVESAHLVDFRQRMFNNISHGIPSIRTYFLLDFSDIKISDLRAPLHGVLATTAELLRTHPDDQPIQIIEQAAHCMLNMVGQFIFVYEWILIVEQVDNLMDVCKLAQKTIKTENVTFHVLDVIHSIICIVRYCR